MTYNTKLPLGECPWCKKDIRAELIESNSFPRRNIYQCPGCKGKVLVCYSPGCDNLARWGQNWDDFYCPDCTSNLGPLSTINKIFSTTNKIKKPKF